VELRADAPNVRIERVMGSVHVPVCYAPCRMVLPRDNVYVVGGTGVRYSSPFVLPYDRPHVTLDVDTGSSSRLSFGAFLIGAGLIVGYTGMLILAPHGDMYSNDPYAPPIHNSQERNRTGTGMLLGGLALGTVGLIVVLSTQTTVRSSTGIVIGQSPPRPRKRPAVALTERGLEF
jgi:hypothetical protein